MLLIPALANAVADIDSINVANKARVLYEGAGAHVTVNFTCSPADGVEAQVNFFVALTQRSGQFVAFGDDGVQLPNIINCTVINTPDGRHAQKFEIIITSKLKIFRTGSAVAQFYAALFGQNGPELIPGGTKKIQLIED